ncbi:flagellar protein export ATPase FliI [Aquisalimonas sp.]|uniref:flagellar protein export ATPase FliI n=1 Tax=Aquisalimonas sp. TaxID=1872621 RepID=UPI0025C40017|nr:flagellar protein export ATPase FliI [Aquisalimonas sp.]
MSEPSAVRRDQWLERLRSVETQVERPRPVPSGVLRRMVGLTLEAEGCQAPVGARCLVSTPQGLEVEAEVVGFGNDSLYLMPTGDVHGLTPGATVTPQEGVYEATVGKSLLGRILDGAGRAIDGGGSLGATERMPLLGEALNPLSRAPIREPLDTGVRAINGLLTVGRGQRMGLFAGSGVGKSVLLGMMTRYTNADVVVVGLIGERGREVKEFIEDILGEEGLKRSVVVAAPADASPLMRLHGAMQATAIAEYFRDQGQQVLLLMDSLTRYAQAQREIGLSIGEPPTTKGYPPSVFARLPRLVERAGNGEVGGGSITAFYTVLAEGDDQNDPIADAARAILDGHVVLSRDLADSGHYPAIDIEASVSRAMQNIVDPEHRVMAQRFQQIYGVWRQNRDLINVGAYQRGTDPRVDEAIEMRPRLLEYLQQDLHAAESLGSSIEKLQAVLPTQ